MKRVIFFLAAWLVCGAAATAFAQGVQTGTIRGVVKDQQGLPTPGVTVDQSVSMRTAGVAETVDVVAETPPPIATPVVGANYKHEEIESLATPRTIQGIAQLAPALTTNSPNGTQLVINGGFAYDNI